MAQTSNITLAIGGIGFVLGAGLLTAAALFISVDAPDPGHALPVNMEEAAPAEAAGDEEEAAPEAAPVANPTAAQPDGAPVDAAEAPDDAKAPEPSGEQDWSAKRAERRQAWRSGGLSAARAFGVAKGLDSDKQDAIVAELLAMHDRIDLISKEYDEGLSTARGVREATAAAQEATALELQNLLGQELADELRQVPLQGPYGGKIF